MKMQRSAQYKRRSIPAPIIGLAVMVGGLAAPVFGSTPAYAAANSFYLSPASANVTVNATFKVGVRINAGESINAVEANLAYNQSQLQYVGIDGAGSAFGIDASSSGGGGSVKINRGQIGGVTGDKLIATVTFKALATNVTSGVSFAGSSQALRNSDSSNVLSGTSGGSYSLKAVATASPKPPAASPAPSTPSKTPTPAPASPVAPVSPTAPDEVPATPTPGAVTPNREVPTDSSTTNVDGSLTGSKTAVLGFSGLAVLIVAVVTVVMLLKRRRSVAALPGGAQIGDAHATIFGPSQPAAPVTPGVVTSAPVAPPAAAQSVPASGDVLAPGASPTDGAAPQQSPVPAPVSPEPVLPVAAPPAAPIVPQSSLTGDVAEPPAGQNDPPVPRL